MSRSPANGTRVVRSSGNVFRDIGIARPDEKKTKLRLAVAVNGILQERKLTQKQAGSLLRITQPKVSALANYRLSGFSVERLMNFLNALGREIQIVIRKPQSSRIAGIRVKEKAARKGAF
jgi:predicted XRE-type DNA-binding protein